LDLAHELAAALDADLVIANDPDTDRLSVSAPDLAGGWRQLTGNQVGSLLGDFVLRHTSEPRPIVLSSIVSSPHLAQIAALHGARHESTLTGFKWIWNAALALEGAGIGRYVFGYEEALGYSIGRVVRDKDGISAAVAFATIAAAAASAGQTVWDLLAALAVRDGLWVSAQKSIVRTGSEGTAEIGRAIDAIAAGPPVALDGHPVVAGRDFRVDAHDRPPWLGATPLIELDLGEAGRALIRPSGTEPKLKIYVDASGPFAAGDDWFGAEAALRAAAGRIADEVVAHLGLGGG
ncbi:MAG: phospho-sugar mutase, partial [Actinobacteria bacterium]